jgi:hypothetical protein
MSPGPEEEDFDNKDAVSSVSPIRGTSGATATPTPDNLGEQLSSTTSESLESDCLPRSSDICLYDSADFVRWSGLELERAIDSWVGRAEYDEACGTTRRKKNETKTMPNVPTESMRRNLAVSSGKATEESCEKMNALRPKAARGNAVALPRCSGQFSAAIGCQLIMLCGRGNESAYKSSTPQRMLRNFQFR